MTDLSGQKFGRLTVKQFAGRRRTAGGTLKYYWKCKCSCGIQVVCDGGCLKRGTTKSCGCLNLEVARERMTGANHKNYKGGFKTKGSVAWANNRLRKAYDRRFAANDNNYAGPVGSAQEVLDLWALCGGKCRICECSESELNRALSLDHCHATGRLRGFLCKACNILLGEAKDSIERLEAAIKYLSK